MAHRSETTSLLFSTLAILLLGACAENERTPGVEAAARGCADNRTAMQDYAGIVAPYFGCANEHNLATMVDNPGDLKRGRPIAPADGEHESASVDAYREGAGKPASQPQQQQPTLFGFGALSAGDGSK